jgi:glycosyltransferase involved in cell wall biosynthesis
MSGRRVALIHDWLHAPGGGEAVLASLLQLFPGAPVYTLVDFLTESERARIGAQEVFTTPLQRIPGARRWFRYIAALFPQIIETLDVSSYDVIVSDSHAIAKGVRTRRGQLHICYCHTPARFAWTMAPTYRGRAASGNRWREAIAQRAQTRFRSWDLAASRRVDHFIANSRHIAESIAKCYGREASVVYPPVDVERFDAVGRSKRTNDYVTVSRLVPYKRVDLLVEAFRRMPRRRLIVIGSGPERSRLARDLPPNVILAGSLDDDQTARRLGDARAFVFAAKEDFGIAPVEAQAAGTPVIAYRAGALSETIVDLGASQPTGVLYDEQSPEAIVAAVERYETTRIDPEACRQNALRFSAARFRTEMAARLGALCLPSH